MRESTALGRKVRELRNRERLSQQELANQVGVERTYISQIERGYTKLPSIEVFRALAAALHTTVDDLLLTVAEVPRPVDISDPNYDISFDFRRLTPAQQATLRDIIRHFLATGGPPR